MQMSSNVSVPLTCNFWTLPLKHPLGVGITLQYLNTKSCYPILLKFYTVDSEGQGRRIAILKAGRIGRWCTF